MSLVTFAAHSRYRVYDLDLPFRIPCFGVGFAISKFKQIGVWSKLPPALRAKAKDARGTWSGLKLTRRDLDSVSDDVWEIIAAEFSVRWRYAAKPVESGAAPVAALGGHAGAVSGDKLRL
jgi:hypothetical protein